MMTRSKPRAAYRSIAGAAIIFAFGYAFIPSLLQVTLGSRPVAQLGETFAQTSLSATSQAILQALVVVTTAAAFVHDALRRTLRFPRWLWLYLAPCAAVTVSSYIASHTVGVAVIIYALIGVLIASYDDPIRLIRLIGRLTVVIAVVSIAMGILLPSVALMSQAGVPDAKAFIGDTLLVGPTYHPNNLGQTLALGLPTVLLLEKPRSRAISVVIVLFGLLWTGSRTGLTAGILGLLVAGIWYVLTHRADFLARVLLIGIYVAVVPITFLIVLLNNDPAAYSGRGYIWSRSLEFAHGSPILGFGVDVYYRISESQSNFGALAYHGHNMAVNTLLLAGGVGLAALVVLWLVMLRHSWRLGRLGYWALTPWPVTFVVLGWLESPTNFYSFSYISWVAWPMLALSLSSLRKLESASIAASTTMVPTMAGS
ncbi:MAG: hypothetical protein BGN98_13940 [Microbacterium sp. 69-7]|nr:MAG: hypothetical protein BGN98_13940 [Microbacterium sp. 69-7]